MHIKMKDGSNLELEAGSTAKDLAEHLKITAPNLALAAEINGKTVDLSHPLTNGDLVELLSFEDKKGKEVFWHTSAHLLAQAILRLWPNAKPTIGPPIENGFYYDFADLEISDEDFGKIEDEMKKIVSENFASKREVFSSKLEALKHFASNKYKKELIEEIPEGETLSGYRQGEFFDLCRGPHLPNLGKIKALKVMKTSGAYWRGDSKNEMLTRIYGITFPDRQMLKDYLVQLEEAKKRDHKVLGPKLDLFSFKEEAAGMPFIHPKGLIVWNALIGFLRGKLDRGGYIEIKTPTLLARELWECSGHWQNYKEHMFTSQIEDRDWAIKPMNCPGCMLFFKSSSHSYRDLPLRVAEIGNVHRFEPSGSLSGLMRVRSFHQDDAHIFMKPEDIEGEILGILQFADEVYSTFGLEYHLELSTRPEKGTIGTDEYWLTATDGLTKALEKSGRAYKLNPGDGAFYGPKIDFHIKDAIGRTWQCGTIQLDMALPERFELEYTASDGTKVRPIMLHRAIFGSIERFFGILIEHFHAKFPLWLSPLQVRILTVADRHNEFGLSVLKEFKRHGFHVDIDDSHESVSKKVRTAQLAQANYILTIGDKEVEHQSINVRTRDNQVHGEMQVQPFIEALIQERDSKSLKASF